MWHAIWNNSNKKMDSHKEYRKDYLLCLFQFQLLCMNRTFSVFRNISHFLKLFFCFHSSAVCNISSVVCQSQQTNCYGCSSSLATDLKSRCLFLYPSCSGFTLDFLTLTDLTGMVQEHRKTESNYSLGWKGPLEVLPTFLPKLGVLVSAGIEFSSQ